MSEHGRSSIFSVVALVALFIPPASFGKGAASGHDAGSHGPAAKGQPDPELEELVRNLAGGDVSERQRAAISLGNVGGPGAVEPLIKALADEDSFVRDFAVRALGGIRDPRAVDPLIRALGDASSLVQRSAAKALGSIQDPKAVESLVKCLKDENVLVRRSAAAALGNIADARAIGPLIETLGDDNFAVREIAEQALVESGEPAVPALVSALGDWTLGPAVAGILASLKWQPRSQEDRVRLDVAARNRQALTENWDHTRRVLLADAGGENPRRVENAVYALIGLGRDEVAAELVGILQARGSADMAKVFLQCGNPRLSDAARAWAVEGGAEIEGGGESSAVIWGGMGSSS